MTRHSRVHLRASHSLLVVRDFASAQVSYYVRRESKHLFYLSSLARSQYRSKNSVEPPLLGRTLRLTRKPLPVSQQNLHHSERAGCRILTNVGLFALRRSALRSASSRWLTTEATPSTSQTPPPPTTSADPKLNGIVDEISGLTLLQAADLVSLLKVSVLSDLQQHPGPF